MPIYTYRCKKCLEEFDVQHEMSQNLDRHSQLENQLCDGNLERAQYIPLNTSYVPPEGKALEERMRQHLEDLAEEKKKDSSRKMSFDLNEIKEKIKNGA